MTIIGYTDLPSRLATQARTLYATNLLRLTEDMCKAKRDGEVVNVDMDDEVIRGTTVVKEGEITWPPPAPKLSAAPAAAKPAAAAMPPRSRRATASRAGPMRRRRPRDPVRRRRARCSC